MNKAHSDETDNKITQLSSDNERLKIQLKDKLEQNELLKIKLNLKSESQDSLDRNKTIFSLFQQKNFRPRKFVSNIA